MRINAEKVNDTICDVREVGDTLALVLPEQDGFYRMIAFHPQSIAEVDTGGVGATTWGWVHKDFRVTPKKKKRKRDSRKKRE